jgi:hypothetical protein
MEKDKEIKDLRTHLFAQMDRLNDPACDLEKELKKAGAMVSIGNVIVSSAKAEVDFMKITKSRGTGFIAGGEDSEADGKKGTKKHLGNGK